jgi:hypothetical protein
MIETKPLMEIVFLEDRLYRGMELLFDMERRGELTGEYERYLHLWSDLLDRYEGLNAA